MSNIHKRQLEEILQSLPEIDAFDPSSDLRNIDDVFLCALGFEPRCLEIPTKLRKGNYKVKKAIVIKYATNRDDNEINLPMLEEHLREVAESVDFLREDSPEFLQHLTTLITEATINAGATVTFDISVAANRLVVKCLNALLDLSVDLRIVYSEAAIYFPSFEDYQANTEAWQSEDVLCLEKGVSDIVFSEDHPGNHLDPLPDSIIIFPTFKKERSWAAINRVDPSLVTSPRDKVIWLLGSPHHPEDEWRKEAMISINQITPEMKQYDVSTFDYKETLKILHRIHDKIWQDYNISLLPLGSKLQAVGISLFCYLHSDVRLMYAIPKEYNANKYSDGCKALWKLSFGSMKALREELDSVGKLSLID